MRIAGERLGWTLFKANDMKKLRETLHARLSALGVLLAAASLCVGLISSFLIY